MKHVGVLKMRQLAVVVALEMKLKVHTVALDLPVLICKVLWVTTAATSIPLAIKHLRQTINSTSETTHAVVSIHAVFL
eukprot:scaffold195995_cov22-Cyclotella_meneghiniana.AAC.1